MKFKTRLQLTTALAVVFSAGWGCSHTNYNYKMFGGTEGGNLVNVFPNCAVLYNGHGQITTNYWGKHGWTTNAP